MRWHHLALVALAGLAAVPAACAPTAPDGPSLSRPRSEALRVGDRVPNTTERAAVGAIAHPVTRGTPEFMRLVECDDPHIVFKDEEKSGADRLMTPRLRDRLVRLSAMVRKRWPGLRLRVTEAWDEQREHGEGSLHYEGRAADVTLSDMDPAKLGDVAALAVEAGVDWAYYEDETHVHVSVTR